jgi:hypothetical protein
LGWLARENCSAEENGSFLLSPCPPRFGKCVLLAKAAPAGHRRLALRKGIEPAIRRSLWISRAPGAIGVCFVNKNREHTKLSRCNRDHAHARLLELEHSALIEFIMLTSVSVRLLHYAKGQTVPRTGILGTVLNLELVRLAACRRIFSKKIVDQLDHHAMKARPFLVISLY